MANDEAPKKPSKKPAAKAAPKKPAPPPPKPTDDDDELKGYGVTVDVETEEQKKNKPKFEPVKDRFKRSARPKALAAVVMPSNMLLIVGLFMGVMSVSLIIANLWPMVFPEREHKSKDDVQVAFDAKVEEVKKAKPVDVKYNSMWIGIYIAALVYGGSLCLCASKMQNLDSYGAGIIGCVLSILAAFALGFWGWNYATYFLGDEMPYYTVPAGGVLFLFALGAGTSGFRTLARAEVKAGFDEDAPNAPK
jgi:hypothetical protein